MKKPAIHQLERLVLGGFNFFGDPFRSSSGWTEENEIGRTWQRLMAYLHEPTSPLPPFKEKCSYEMHILHPESLNTGEFEVFVGLELAEDQPENRIPALQLPAEMCMKILPPSTYAVFELTGEEITTDWQQFMQQWMDSAGYMQAHPFSFQRYDERFKGLDQITESTIDVFIPVTRSSDT